MWCIHFFIVIKALCNLWCSWSVGFYLIGKPVFTSHIVFLDQCLVSSWWFFLYVPLLIYSHHYWKWAPHRTCHFRNVLITSSIHNNLVFIKVIWIFFFLLIIVAFNKWKFFLLVIRILIPDTHVYSRFNLISIYWICF